MKSCMILCVFVANQVLALPMIPMDHFAFPFQVSDDFFVPNSPPKTDPRDDYPAFFNKVLPRSSGVTVKKEMSLPPPAPAPSVSDDSGSKDSGEEYDHFRMTILLVQNPPETEIKDDDDRDQQLVPYVPPKQFVPMPTPPPLKKSTPPRRTDKLSLHRPIIPSFASFYDLFKELLSRKDKQENRLNQLY